ncbi:hypothetical protein CEP51_009231 [Fusarium floridanum]|uniref:AMP-dependent synthetase/ligase domain-containing protein n=1 Tax=Fusarium floridanum TaxID=1325733 RepID=A0A428RIA4_9HYPO|nr:hypothetical protein CEP51_009231 [Fusarium floridanum]
MPHSLQTPVKKAAIAAGAATATLLSALYANTRYGVSYDINQLLSEKAFRKRIDERARALGDDFSLYHMMQLAEPQAEALWFEGRGWTYAELILESNRLAAVFHHHGVSSGDVVAIFTSNSPEMVLSLVAVSKLGAIPALINTALQRQTLQHCLDIANAKILVCTPDLAPAVADLASVSQPPPTLSVSLSSFAPLQLTAEVCAVVGIIQVRYEDLASPMAASAPLPTKRLLKDVGALVYTSGTSGKPKAVAVKNFLLVLASTPTTVDIKNRKTYLPLRIYSCLPLFHATALLAGLYYITGVSGTLCLARKFSASRFSMQLVESRATRMLYVGELCRYLVNAPPSSADRAHRCIVAHGNGLNREVWLKLKHRFGIPEIREVYRSTEGIAKFDNITRFERGAGMVGFAGPVKRCAEDDVFLVKFDPTTEAPYRDPATGFCVHASADEPGEAIGRVRSMAFYNEYYNNPEATNLKLISDVFEKGDLFQRTGDLLVRQKSGYIRFHDRSGDTFRWKGENVSAGEVREHIAQLPNVQECSVYAVKLEGYDGQAGAATITLADPSQEAEFVDHLYSRLRSGGLTAYQLPKLVRFSPMIEMTATFKQSSVALKSLSWDPAMTTDQADSTYWLNGKQYSKIDSAAWSLIETGKAKLHVKFFHGPDNVPNSTRAALRATAAQGNQHSPRVGQGKGPVSTVSTETDDDASPPTQDAMPVHVEEVPVAADLDALATASMLHAHPQRLGESQNMTLQPTLHEPHHDSHQHPPLPEPAARQDSVAPNLAAARPHNVDGGPGFGAQDQAVLLPSGGSVSELLHPSFLMGEISSTSGADLTSPTRLTQPLADPVHSHSTDLQLYEGAFDLFNNNNNHLHYFDYVDLAIDSYFPSTASRLQTSSSDCAIPAERFAHVARLWPQTGSSLADDQATKLWAEVVAYKGDNILMDTSIAETSPAPSGGRENESTWGLDEDKRQDMMREVALDFPRSQDGANRPSFPGTRLLNLGLDVVYRQSQSLLICIHRPTFSAKTVPNLVIWSFCLLGLMLLDSKQVRALALHFLPVATQRCCDNLATPCFGPGGSAKLIGHLTSATVLLKAWKICPPRCSQHETLIRMLYTQAISLAQTSGLFATRPASPSMIALLKQVSPRDGHQSRMMSDDALWKAWARVESVKQLIASLALIDAWLAHRLSEPPLIRDPIVRFEHPCSAELFQCSSARAWKRLIDGGASISSGYIVIHMHELEICLEKSPSFSSEGIIGLLSIIWIRILEARRHVVKATSTGGYTLGNAPCRVLTSEETGRVISRTLGEVYVAHERFLRFKNPNCITMWHFLNLHLFADLDVFELAAGKGGADSAHEALQAIALWSQTWYSRRACLHAASIFAAMARRGLNDGTALHSEASIFAAALVLGLYVFMMPTNRDNSSGPCQDAEPYEFLSEVDWATLGGDWGTSPLFTPSSVVSDDQESAASRFIWAGGVVSFSGVILEGGYNAAKRILLEFASLLEDVGKWKAKGFCHVLKILSDSLLDMEDQTDVS